MERVWGIEGGAEEGGGFVRVLETLKVTVDAVRAVRAWSLAAPASSLTHRRGYRSAHGIGTGSGRGKPPSTISTPSRPAIVGRVISSGSTTPSAAEIEGAGDPLVELRRRALDVLVCLRGLEEKFRVEEAGDASVEEETEERPEGLNPEDAPADPPIPAPESETENLWLFSERFGDTSSSENTSAEKVTWYERLASGDGGGWVYRDDVVPEEVHAERKVVVAYLRAVEGVLGGCPWRVGLREDRADEGDVFGGNGRTENGSVSRMDDAAAEGRSLPDWAVAELWEDVPDREST